VTDPNGAVLRRPPRQPKNHVALFLSVISGFGHLYLEYYLLGAALFAVFVTALNGVFLGFTLHSLEHPAWVQWTSITVGGVTWLVGFWHCWKLSYGTDRVDLAQQKEQLLRDGLIDYLRDELEGGLIKLERAVALDVDWEDPDPLFHLGVVASRLAERRARRGDSLAARADRRRAQWAFRTCLQRDPARKWESEIQTELKRMRRTVSITGRLRPLPGGLNESTDMLPRLGDVSMPLREATVDELGLPAPVEEEETLFSSGDELEAPAPEPALPEAKGAGAGRRTERTSRRLVKRRLKRLLEDEELEARAAARDALARSGERVTPLAGDEDEDGSEGASPDE
jgi:hypothetical protein